MPNKHGDLDVNERRTAERRAMGIPESEPDREERLGLYGTPEEIRAELERQQAIAERQLRAAQATAARAQLTLSDAATELRAIQRHLAQEKSRTLTGEIGPDTDTLISVLEQHARLKLEPSGPQVDARRGTAEFVLSVRGARATRYHFTVRDVSD